jgi:hypothetical protein
MEARALHDELTGEVDDSLDAPVEDIIASHIDSLHADISARQRQMLTYIAAFDDTGAWADDGCRDMAMWLSGRLGIRPFTARKWVACAHAINHLPLTSEALETGALCLDKVVELTRFATEDSEARLIKWAQRVSVAAVRAEAERAAAPELEETRDHERARSLRWWWYDDHRALGLEGYFPAAQGAAIVAALRRAATEVPDTDDATGDPGFDTPGDRRNRRHADALWALASQKIAGDCDADRATVVVHTALESLGDRGPFCELEGGGVLNKDTARRLSCDARLQFVLTDNAGNPLGIGRTSRNVPGWLMRRLRFRDHGCTFPGCGTRALFTPTTSGTGRTAVRPTTTICGSCVRGITHCCTSSRGTCASAQTTTSGGSGPTGRATTRDRIRRGGAQKSGQHLPHP